MIKRPHDDQAGGFRPVVVEYIIEYLHGSREIFGDDGCREVPKFVYIRIAHQVFDVLDFYPLFFSRESDKFLGFRLKLQ